MQYNRAPIWVFGILVTYCGVKEFNKHSTYLEIGEEIDKLMLKICGGCFLSESSIESDKGDEDDKIEFFSFAAGFEIHLIAIMSTFFSHSSTKPNLSIFLFEMNILHAYVQLKAF